MLAPSSSFGNSQEMLAADGTSTCADLCSSGYPAIPVSSFCAVWLLFSHFQICDLELTTRSRRQKEVSIEEKDKKKRSR